MRSVGCCFGLGRGRGSFVGRLVRSGRGIVGIGGRRLVVLTGCCSFGSAASGASTAGFRLLLLSLSLIMWLRS